MKSTQIPAALRDVPPLELENYVGNQIAMFANGLAHRLGQHGYHIPPDVYKESAREVFQLLITEPSPERPIARAQDLQLVFRHDCLALGCLTPSCRLCKHNPSRRCAVNFDRKYLVNDVLRAKCQAVIRAEIVERSSNQPMVDSDLQDKVVLQMAILDGNAYDAKFEAGMEGDFEACMLLLNNKNSPTLVGTAVTNDQRGFIIIPLHGSRALLPDLRVTDSSEAMLSGRKPPLRLMMRALYKDTLLPVPYIRHAISEGFVVATRRTRTAGKVEIPSVDDHVSKLEHMGRETVKKLSDVMDAAHQAGIDDLDIPGMAARPLCIDTVGAFQQLVLVAEKDPNLQKRLQQVLKLNKEKWEEARDHALKAVVIDNRMRVWWTAQKTADGMRLGMVFSCTKGTVDLETPTALIQEGSKILFAADWSPAQLELVRRMQPMALSQWWQASHANWDLLPWDSEVYKAEGRLVKANIAEPEGLQSGDVQGGSGSMQVPALDSGGKLSSSQLRAAVGSGSAPSSANMRGSGGSMGAPRPLSSAAAHASLPGASKHMAPGLHTVFDDGTTTNAPSHGGRAGGPDVPSGQHHANATGRAGSMQHNKSEEIFDMLPSIPSMHLPTGPYDTHAQALRSTQDVPGGGSRLLSGMDTSIEGLMADPISLLHLSRNTSGLDTMQSIEQALPDGDVAAQ